MGLDKCLSWILRSLSVSSGHRATDEWIGGSVVPSPWPATVDRGRRFEGILRSVRYRGQGSAPDLESVLKPKMETRSRILPRLSSAQTGRSKGIGASHSGGFRGRGGLAVRNDFGPVLKRGAGGGMFWPVRQNFRTERNEKLCPALPLRPVWMGVPAWYCWSRSGTPGLLDAFDTACSFLPSSATFPSPFGPSTPRALAISLTRRRPRIDS